MDQRLKEIEAEIKDIAWVYDKLEGQWRIQADVRLAALRAELHEMRERLAHDMERAKWALHRARIINLDKDEDVKTTLSVLFG